MSVMYLIFVTDALEFSMRKELFCCGTNLMERVYLYPRKASEFVNIYL